MKALKKKWNSNRGATILFALLFMLLCVTVGASVLAAAASNAGKVKVNREQQQNYYTVSSALNYVCDELFDGLEYTGRYQYGRLEEWVEIDADVFTRTNYKHCFDQLRGALSLGTKYAGSGAETALAGLRNGMDAMFAECFPEDGDTEFYLYNPCADTSWHYWELEYPGPDINAPSPNYTWSFCTEIDPDTDTTGIPGEQFLPVHITARLDENSGIILAATLYYHDELGNEDTDRPVYSMEARLKPSSKLNELLREETNESSGMTLYLDGDDEDIDNAKGTGVTPGTDGAYWNVNSSCETVHVTWELDYIKKGTS